MKVKFLLVILVAVFSMLTSCTSSCPAYHGARNYDRPLYRPTFKKDEGYQKNRFSSSFRSANNKYAQAARKAADQADAELYLSILKI